MALNVWLGFDLGIIPEENEDVVGGWVPALGASNTDADPLWCWCGRHMFEFGNANSRLSDAATK